MTLLPPTLEATLSHDVRLALGREPDLVLWRNHVGAGEVHGRYQTFGLCPGSADTVGLLGPRGRWFCLEFKSKRGQAGKDQEMFAALMRGLGGFYCLVKSVEAAKAALERARKGALQ